MKEEKKKYWLKIEKGFLNSSHIKVIKNMPNGKDYIIFYLAIMLESTSTEGHLRFNELVPYNEEMLASVTDTNVDIVRSALKIFQGLGLISILQDGTIFLPDVPKRVGKESESAERVRLYRERHKLLQCNADVTDCNDNKEKEKEKEKEEEKDIYSSSANYNASEIEETLPNENDNSILLATNEKKQQHEKEIIDNNKQVFDYWNSKKIIVHKTLNEELNNSISKFLKKYKLAEFKTMVDRYKKVLDDKKYFFSYVWSLKDFLNRKNGAVDFADDGSKWQDYCLKVGVESKQEFTETQEGVFKI